MRKSTVLFVLVSIVCATAAGCMPNADRGPIAFAPRLNSVPAVPVTPDVVFPDDHPVSNVQR